MLKLRWLWNWLGRLCQRLRCGHHQKHFIRTLFGSEGRPFKPGAGEQVKTRLRSMDDSNWRKIGRAAICERSDWVLFWRDFKGLIANLNLDLFRRYLTFASNGRVRQYHFDVKHEERMHFVQFTPTILWSRLYRTNNFNAWWKQWRTCII